MAVTNRLTDELHYIGPPLCAFKNTEEETEQTLYSCLHGNEKLYDSAVKIFFNTFYLAASPSVGIERIMSESPGSVMLRTDTRKYFPQAVPSSILFPV